MSMDPVVHFEMPAEDSKRMSVFYSKAFGWQTKMLGPDMGEYVIATTTESVTNPNGTGMPKNPGAINGGFYKRSDDPLSQYPSIVVAVEDINESIKKVLDAGGTTHGDIETIPGVGLRVSVIDTEGNRISVLQPEKM